MKLNPTAELVAKAWTQGVPGIPAHSVATTLPKDESTWAASGFVQVTAFPSSPAIHVQKRQSTIDMQFWFQPVKPGGNKIPWNRAFHLAETFFDATYDQNALNVQRLLILPADYDNARVLTVLPSEPERRGEDAAGNAIAGLTATFNWIRVPK